MEINEIRTFASIAQNKSFSKAAQVLGYSQSAVTVQIHNLEKELGVRLFDRLGKSVILTNHGKTFLEYSLKILNSIEEARDMLSQHDEPNGTVHIGTIDSLCASVFPELMHSYHNAYPDIKINITTDTPTALLQMLNDNEIDMLYLLDEEINDTRFVRIMNIAEPVCFAASADHPVFETNPSSWEALLKYPFLLTEKAASYRKVLDYRMSRKKLEIQPVFESNNTDLLISMVLQGDGITFLPEYALKEGLESGKLRKILISEFDVIVYRQLLVHKDKWISREMKAFSDLIISKENSCMLYGLEG